MCELKVYFQNDQTMFLPGQVLNGLLCFKSLLHNDSIVINLYFLQKKKLCMMRAIGEVSLEITKKKIYRFRGMNFLSR